MEGKCLFRWKREGNAYRWTPLIYERHLKRSAGRWSDCDGKPFHEGAQMPISQRKVHSNEGKRKAMAQWVYRKNGLYKQTKMFRVG